MRTSLSPILILIFGLAFGDYCNCSRPPQDYLSIEVGSSRAAKAIDWLVVRLDGKAGFEPSDTSESRSTLSIASPETPAELGPTAGAEIASTAVWSGEMVANFLKRAISIANRAKSVTRSELPPPHLDKTGVLSYDGDFFTLEYGLRKLLNLMSESTVSKSNRRVCFSESDTNEHLQLIIRAFGSIANFDHIMRSADSNAIAVPNHSKLLNYLRLYGTNHYADCLARVDEKFRAAERQLDGEMLARFDKLVASTRYTQFKKPLDERLARIARDLDFNKSKLVINKLAAAVVSNLTPVEPDSAPAPVTSVETLTAFLSSACHNIKSAHLNSVFAVYNLARLFVPKKANQLELRMPDSFMKINEYQRLCIQFRSPQSRRDVTANLIDNNDKALFRKLFGYERVAAKAKKRNKKI